jgi:hypothetical protein
METALDTEGAMASSTCWVRVAFVSEEKEEEEEEEEEEDEEEEVEEKWSWTSLAMEGVRAEMIFWTRADWDRDWDCSSTTEVTEVTGVGAGAGSGVSTTVVVVVVLFRAAKAAWTASSIWGPSSLTTWLTREPLSELELELVPELKPDPEIELSSTLPELLELKKELESCEEDWLEEKNDAESSETVLEVKDVLSPSELENPLNWPSIFPSEPSTEEKVPDVWTVMAGTWETTLVKLVSTGLEETDLLLL